MPEYGRDRQSRSFHCQQQSRHKHGLHHEVRSIVRKKRTNPPEQEGVAPEMALQVTQCGQLAHCLAQQASDLPQQTQTLNNIPMADDSQVASHLKLLNESESENLPSSYGSQCD